MDTKQFKLSIKAVGEEGGLAEGQFIGYASVFGNVDSYGDVVIKGAFENTLKEWADSGAPIPVLWGHDMYDPFSNIGMLLEAEEDDHGLLIKGQFDLDEPKALKVYKLVKSRRVGDMSFAYDVLKAAAAVVDGQNVLELHELRLYEASIVPIGANSETEILAVKSNAQALLSGVKAGRAISVNNEGDLRKAYESIGAVLSALGTNDQEKADKPPAAKDHASTEEPPGANVTATSEELPVSASVPTLFAEVQLLALGQEGDQK